MSTELFIALSAVIVSVENDSPLFLATRRKDQVAALPFGAFDPATDRTFELALRGWVARQTGFPLGFVEQLYTFGDRGRETPDDNKPSAQANTRMVSVGYLGLTPQPAKLDAGFDAEWHSWYTYFPWEDHRTGRPHILERTVAPGLYAWAAGNDQRLERARLAFGLDGRAWIEERTLERYELLYEAGLVSEAARDVALPDERKTPDAYMASDHRRILATAISRLRGKLKYRPVIFDLMDEYFTLSALQRTVEALLGRQLHTQNFRRALARIELVEGTGRMETGTGGRPAEFFRFRRDLHHNQTIMGLSTPAKRQD